MNMSQRQHLQSAAIPLVFTLLMTLFLALQFFAAAPAIGNLRLLSPAETSSPRAALQGFRNDVSRASALLMEAYRQNRSEPGFTWSQSVTEKVTEAETLLARAARSLDLRHLPPAELEHRSLEATLMLKEVLDRVPLPETNAIPGEDDLKGQPLTSWNVPGTDIRIVRQAEGPRTGEYLFSSETVQRLDDFYRLIRHHPNLQGGTDDFYDFFSLTPGYLLPPKWYGLIEALPPFWRIEIEGQAIWQWVGFALVLGLVSFALVAIRRLVRNAERTSSGLTSLTANILLPLAVAVAALFIGYTAERQINLTGRVNDIVTELAQGTAYLAAIWAILKFSNSLAERLSLSGTESIDAHLARAAVRIGGLAVAVALLIYGASYLGIPLAGLLAGLGVGGLAVALAAKPTLENFIGGLILYADRPVRVGDLCRFGNLEGRVEEIGLRSTRIRGLDRTLITIPNATFVNMNIINLTNRDRMPYDRVVSLKAADSVGIRKNIDALASLVEEHPKVERGSVKVRLREGHEEKPKAEICALISTSSWDAFLQIQQEIDLMLRDAILSQDKEDKEVLSAAHSNVYPLKEVEEG